MAREISAQVWPMHMGKTIYMIYPMSHLYVAGAAGHNSVSIDVCQVYKKARKAKKEHKVGLRIELSRLETLRLIEALSISLQE